MASEETSRSRAGSSFAVWRSPEFQPAVLGAGVIAGVVAYSVEIVAVAAFAALIFSGGLTAQLSPALDYILLGDAVLCGVVALVSSYPGSIAIVQDTSAVLLAGMAASCLTALPASAGPADRFATVLMLLVCTAALTGGFLLLLGVCRVAGLVRFLPFPVLGGFLAGTGWLLALGGVQLMAGTSTAMNLVHPAVLVHWIPGLLLGVVLLVVLGRSTHPFSLPVIWIVSMVGFYAVAWISGSSHTRLSANGWLLGTATSSSSWRFPLGADILGRVHWPVLLAQAPSVVPLLVVTTIGLLLNAGGLELVARRDIDLNRELIAAGVANLAVGATGGIVGYQAISSSALNRTISGGRRTAGLVTALLLGATAFLGGQAITYVPTVLLGALLIYLGLELLHEWVYKAWFGLARADFLIVVLIAAVIAARGFLTGIAAGTALAVLVFAVNAGRTNVVRNALTGVELRSRVTRGPAQEAILEAYGSQLYLLKLQGMIFFGTAHSLYERVRARILDASLPTLSFVVLDFTHVTGMDATGLLSFSRLRQLAGQRGLTLVLTGLSHEVSARFDRGDFGDGQEMVRFFADLDHGLEWCEEAIIAARDQSHGALPPSSTKAALPDHVGGAEFGLPAGAEATNGLIRAQLQTFLPAGAPLERLLCCLQRQEFAPGDHLIRQGEEANRLYLIESGQVTAQLEADGQAPVRLETMRGGRVVGELAFYLGGMRTASVVADEPSVVYCLSRETLDRLETEDPLAASLLHRAIVYLLGERVVHLIRAVQALQR